MTRTSPAAVFLAALLLVSACSSSSDSTTTTTTAPGGTTTAPTSGDTTSTSVPGTITVRIVEPEQLSTIIATIDLGGGVLAAPVRLAADVGIPAGETVEVSWASDLDGPLGEGSVLDVQLSNDGEDVVSHTVTVTVTSSGGGQGSASVDVIVQVPSN